MIRSRPQMTWLLVSCSHATGLALNNENIKCQPIRRQARNCDSAHLNGGFLRHAGSVEPAPHEAAPIPNGQALRHIPRAASVSNCEALEPLQEPLGRPKRPFARAFFSLAKRRYGAMMVSPATSGRGSTEPFRRNSGHKNTKPKSSRY